jgi:hypothetical protein
MGGEKRGVGKKPDGSCLYGGEECGRELAWVQRLLCEQIKGAVTKRVAGQEAVEVGAVERVAKTPGLFDVALDGGVCLEGHFDTGEGTNAIEECGVKQKTEVGEGLELRGIVGVVGSQHSGCGGGGLRERGGSIEYGDRHTAVVEFKGEGEADDAGPSNADIGVVHGLSLERE